MPPGISEDTGTMEKIEAITVTVESPGIPDAGAYASSLCSVPTGNLIPLLHEIRHALARWLEDSQPHIIDLRTIPMSPDEEARLVEVLGSGEVSASLSALGNSEIVETAFSGVWLVTHHNDDGVLIGRFIEICQIPEILKSQSEDAGMALQRLDELLSNAEATV
jgi:hydrogenase-1 operon protein HyaF